MKKLLVLLTFVVLLFAFAIPTAAESVETLAEDALVYEGIQARLEGDIPGIRSLYTVSDAKIAALEAQGYTVVYGGIMGIADYYGTAYNTYETLTVTYENGEAVTSAKGGKAVAVYVTGGGGSEAYASRDAEAGTKSFAFTTMFSGNAYQMKESFTEIALCYRGYLLVLDGEGNTVYTKYDAVPEDTVWKRGGVRGNVTVNSVATYFFQKSEDEKIRNNALLSSIVRTCGEYEIFASDMEIVGTGNKTEDGSVWVAASSENYKNLRANRARFTVYAETEGIYLMSVKYAIEASQENKNRDLLIANESIEKENCTSLNDMGAKSSLIDCGDGVFGVGEGLKTASYESSPTTAIYLKQGENIISLATRRVAPFAVSAVRLTLSTDFYGDTVTKFGMGAAKDAQNLQANTDICGTYYVNNTSVLTYEVELKRGEYTFGVLAGRNKNYKYTVNGSLFGEGIVISPERDGTTTDGERAYTDIKGGKVTVAESGTYTVTVTLSASGFAAFEGIYFTGNEVPATVTFDTGVSEFSVVASKDGYVTPPITMPERAGYTHRWVNEDGEAVDITKPFTEDMTLISEYVFTGKTEFEFFASDMIAVGNTALTEDGSMWVGANTENGKNIRANRAQIKVYADVEGIYLMSIKHAMTQQDVVIANESIEKENCTAFYDKTAKDKFINYDGGVFGVADELKSASYESFPTVAVYLKQGENILSIANRRNYAVAISAVRLTLSTAFYGDTVTKLGNGAASAQSLQSNTDICGTYYVNSNSVLTYTVRLEKGEYTFGILAGGTTSFKYTVSSDLFADSLVISPDRDVSANASERAYTDIKGGKVTVEEAGDYTVTIKASGSGYAAVEGIYFTACEGAVTAEYKAGDESVIMTVPTGAVVPLPLALSEKPGCRVVWYDQDGSEADFTKPITKDSVFEARYILEEVSFEVLATDMTPVGNDNGYLSADPSILVLKKANSYYTPSDHYVEMTVDAPLAGLYAVRLRLSAQERKDIHVGVKGDAYRYVNYINPIISADLSLTAEQKTASYDDKNLIYLYLPQGPSTVQLWSRADVGLYSAEFRLYDAAAPGYEAVLTQAPTGFYKAPADDGDLNDTTMNHAKTNGVFMRRAADYVEYTLKITKGGVYDVTFLLGSNGKVSFTVICMKEGAELSRFETPKKQYASTFTGAFPYTKQMTLAAGDYVFRIHGGGASHTEGIYAVQKEAIELTTVTFRYDDKTVTYAIRAGEGVTPPDAEKEGYYLTWETEGGTVVSDFSSITESLDLTAYYRIERALCSVTLHYGDGETMVLSGYEGRAIALPTDLGTYLDETPYLVEANGTVYTYGHAYNGKVVDGAGNEVGVFSADTTDIYAQYNDYSVIDVKKNPLRDSAMPYSVLTVSDSHIGAGYGTWKTASNYTFHSGNNLAISAGRNITFFAGTTVTYRAGSAVTVGGAARTFAETTTVTYAGDTTVTFDKASVIDLADSTTIRFENGISTWERALIMTDSLLYEWDTEHPDMIFLLGDMVSNEYNAKKHNGNIEDHYWYRLKNSYLVKLDEAEIPWFFVYANHDDLTDEEFATIFPNYTKNMFIRLEGDDAAFTVLDRYYGDNRNDPEKYQWGYGDAMDADSVFLSLASTLGVGYDEVYIVIHSVESSMDNLKGYCRDNANVTAILQAHTHYTYTSSFYGSVKAYHDGHFSWNADEWGVSSTETLAERNNAGSFGVCYLTATDSGSKRTVERYMVFIECEYGVASGTGTLYPNGHTFEAFMQERFSTKGTSHRGYNKITEKTISDEE